MKTWICIFYGGFTIWTGLLRGIEAHAYKPNSLWFCMTAGLVAISAAYLMRLGFKRVATIVGGLAGVVVLAFYLSCFVMKPEDDATLRVGLIIVASILYLSVLFLPTARQSDDNKESTAKRS